MIEIDGKDQVDDRDLENGGGQGIGHGRRPALLVFAFDVLMDLARALDQEKQAAGDEDEIAPGEVIAGDAEDRRGEMDHPGDAAEHDHPEHQRERKPDAPRRQPPFGRQPRYEQRDEHDIVDTEHDLHRAQGNEACPRVRVGQPVEHAVGGRVRWRAMGGVRF